MQTSVPQQQEFDTVIACATVYDGSGKAGFKADIGITEDKIAAIASAGSLRGKHLIAAEI